MSKFILLISALFLILTFVHANVPLRGLSPHKQQPWIGLGDRLLHTFFSKTPMPLNITQARNSSDWNTPIENGACIPNLGYGFINDRIVVYYTKAGQLGGFGVRVHGVLSQLEQASFWKRVSPDVYQIEVSTRDPAFACSGQLDTKGGVLGDRLLVAPNSKFPISVPLTEAEADKAQFTKGGCITGMGTHWGFDLVEHPNLSGYSYTLMPVIPMYHDGFVSAILFYTHQLQELWPVGQWEGPFIPSLFCKNFCSDNCMEKESSFRVFSTMHFLFHDASLNKCDDRCPSMKKK
ncbi:hypothetical protein NAEGRDRAFT_81112 [Naegleria gruberi]|uniref:Uncharacterized protein n=1 Tax=Naegleria gruberi TaxID=5762 RepID=D2VSV1_NAEGR|nr:uncharacterized protein NAEGRDRAFT_81112 [Naegleria gruberi]EFC40045.1 hypothetical protein NAEGRDRAFT_81112 [Naegleria gruberi]|eukprot:XP_002672789.1 hypothetical protein NAEGRDRAFT_81112 [Naegleria gruberi strain NEG-M]